MFAPGAQADVLDVSTAESAQSTDAYIDALYASLQSILPDYDISISVVDGQVQVSIVLRTSTPATEATNHAPTISGVASTLVGVDNAYNFAPSVSDADSDLLTFSVQNLPEWAGFDAATGILSGTPTEAQIGTYSDIVISVSDGEHTASLEAFSITVAQTFAGGAVLTWDSPMQNTDGSALVDLAGYRIVYGADANALMQSIDVDAGVTTYIFDNLSPATWYFGVKALNSQGEESELSAIVSKTI